MKNQILFGILFLACLSFAFTSNAQAPTAKKYDNPEWRRIVHIDFHTGKTGRAMEIIENYFEKAGEKAGTPGPLQRYRMETGKYDMVLVWALDGGIESLNWDVSPNNVKWRTALNAICGGKEKADVIQKEYWSLIASSTSQLARVD